MLAAQHALNVGHRVGNLVFAFGERADRLQTIRSVDAEARRVDRDEHFVVRILERARLTLWRQDADDGELRAANANVLADQRFGRRDAEVRDDRVADDGHALTTFVVGGGEHLAGLERVLANLQVVRRGADDLRARVLVAPHDLLLRAHFRLHGEQRRRALVDRLRVVDREALLRAGERDAAAAAALLSRAHREQRGAERRDAILHRLLRARAERDDRDHRADADHDAEHREQRPKLVCAQRAERDADDFSNEHLISLRDRRRPAAAAAGATATGTAAQGPAVRRAGSRSDACDPAAADAAPAGRALRASRRARLP